MLLSRSPQLQQLTDSGAAIVTSLTLLKATDGGFGITIGSSGTILNVYGVAAKVAGFRKGWRIVAIGETAVESHAAIATTLSQVQVGNGVTFHLVPPLSTNGPSSIPLPHLPPLPLHKPHAGIAHANIQQRDYPDDAERLLGVGASIDAPTPVLVSRPEEHEQLVMKAGGDRERNKEKEKGREKELVATPPRADNADATEPLTSTQNIDTGRRYWVAAGAAWWPSMREATEVVGTWQVLGLLVTQVVCTAAILVGESLAVSWVVGGGLAIVVCVLTRLCLNECRMYGCGEYALIALLALLGLAAHGTLMLTVAGWASVISCTGLIGMGCVGGLVVLMWIRCKEGEWDSRWTIIFALALWIAALTVVPAVLFTWADFATSSHATSTLGACGVFVFVTALWMVGWAFLWYRGEKLEPIAGDEHLAALPPVTLQRLKLFTVLSECYNYCGFSYFPALPWKAMEVPPKVPHPQIVMLAGFFYFDDIDTHFWIFFGASVTVVLSFVLLGLTVYFDKPQRQDLVVQILFDLLSFPLIKQLSGVFSCTSASVWIESKDKLSGTIEVVHFCDTSTVSMDMQCMDSDPSVQCWGGQHRSYIVVVLTLLVPYYVAALELQRLAQARQTVVKIDGGWLVVTMQSKFLLAVIASNFGECFPIVMVASVEAVVLSQLIMLCCGLNFSNVHSLNAVRMGGLFAAAFNGMYATFALWHFRDDPAARPPCTMTAPNNGIDGSSSSLQSTTTLQLVNDYSTFFGLVGVNVGAIAYGIWWWWQRRSSWQGRSQFPSLNSINTDASAREVDYSIVESRLRALDNLITSWPEVSADAQSQLGFLFELYTIEARVGDETPQELESATMDLVLGCASLAAPHGVSLLGIDSATRSGQLVLEQLKKIATGRHKCAARVACVKLVAVRNTELQPFLDALQNSSLTSLSLAGAGIGVEWVTAIAALIPTMGALKKVTLSQNNLFGADQYGSHTIDVDQSGWAALCDALPSSPVEELDVADVGMGVKGVTSLAKAMSAGAALNSLTVDSTGVMTDFYGKYGKGTQKTYTLTVGETTMDLSQKNLGSVDVILLTTWIQRPEVSAVLKKITLSNNFLFGFKNNELGGTEHDVDADQSGWSALCDALPRSPVEELIVADVGMGVKGVTSLAKAMSAGAVLAVVNVIGNAIGEPGARSLIEVFDANPRLQSLLGVKPGSTSADFSQTNMQPHDFIILAHELNASRAAAVLTSLILSGNTVGSNIVWFPISVLLSDVDDINAGTVVRVTSSMQECKAAFDACVDDSGVRRSNLLSFVDAPTRIDDSGQSIIDWDDDMEKYLGSTVTLSEVDEDGTAAFEDCDHIQALGQAISSLTDLNVSDCSFTPASIKAFASSVTWAEAALTSLTVDSTGVPKLPESWMPGYEESGPRTYTLTVGDDTINLSQKNLGPADVTLVTTWMQRPEVSAAVLTSLTVDSTGVPKLPDSRMVGYEESGPRTYTLTVGEDVINLSKKNLGPADVNLLTVWMQRPEVSAVLARVSVLSNPIGTDGADALIQVFEQNTKLRTLLGIEEGVNELNLSEKNVDPGQAKILAAELKASRATAALKSLTVDSTGSPKLAVNRVGPTIAAASGPRTYTLTAGEVTIDLRQKNLGPADITLLTTWMQRPEVSAVINEVNVSQNPIGVEGGKALANAIPESSLQCIVIGDESTRIPLHNSEITSLDVSTQKLGPGEVTVVAAAISTYAVLASLTLDQNGIFGELHPWGDCKEADKYVEESTPLLDAIKMSNLTSLSLSKTGMGPKICSRLATSFSAVVKKVVISHNFIFGSKNKSPRNKTQVHDIDADQSGWSALCDALPGSPVEELDVTDVGMGVTGVTSLAKAMSTGAVLASLNVGGNTITGSKCDDSTDWDWQYDLDLTGFRALRQVLGRLNEVNLSDCHLGPPSMPELAKVFCDAKAALTEVNASGNPLTRGYVRSSGTIDKGDDIYGVSILFPAMTKVITLNISNCGLGPSAMPELSKLVRDATAALASLTLDRNGIFGELDEWGNCEETDQYVEESAALLDAIKISNLTSLSLSNTGMGPIICSRLATSLSAALASVNLSGNRAIDQESRSALQESVSSRQPTIELIWDK